VTQWKNLSAGPALRRVVAERLGWHMRKVWVGSGGIAYDFFVYDQDDRIVYHHAVTADAMQNEPTAIDTAWLGAMQDENCPRWDEDLEEALDLAYGMAHKVWSEGVVYHAWVKSDTFSAQATTAPLAVVRAWLVATADDPAFFH
jgi:hypothetical protein